MVSLKYEKMDLRRIPAGTIKIDCSGAYIANDHLLRGNVSLSSTPSPSPPTSDESSSSDDDDVVAAVSESPAKDSKNANITLPKHNSEVIHISVDIGGTLTKLVYFTSASAKGTKSGGKLHFRDFQTGAFETEALQFMIRLVRESMSKKHCPPITYIISTGGGAHKFSKLMTSAFEKSKLPMQIVKKDEMECLIKGLDWLITKIPNEIFTYDLEKDNIRFNTTPVTEKDIYPYLLVNIGSGVSMIKVTGPGPNGFERIGGSSLGGGTLWGLLSLLTDASDYNEMLEMAQKGDNENIDLLVGDIYGSSYNKIGLKSNHIASSFAKVFKKLRFSQSGKKLTTSEKLAHFRQEDIARSLLYSVSNNIGQIAYLQARRFGLKRIYFGGSYISGHMQTIHTLSYASNFWSNGEMQSYFLRHEGYLGSVGAFMMGPNGAKPAGSEGDEKNGGQGK